MDKHTKKTPSLFQYPVLVAFGLFFIGLFVLDMATPDRAYSELENTTLTQRPRLTAVSADGLNNYFTSGSACRVRRRPPSSKRPRAAASCWAGST